MIKANDLTMIKAETQSVANFEKGLLKNHWNCALVYVGSLQLPTSTAPCSRQVMVFHLWLLIRVKSSDHSVFLKKVLSPVDCLPFCAPVTNLCAVLLPFVLQIGGGVGK